MKVKKNTSMNKNNNNKKRTTVFVLISVVIPCTNVLCAAED